MCTRPKCAKNQMELELLPPKKSNYIFLIRGLSTSALKSAKLDQMDAHGAQRRAVIKEFCNYRPTSTTGGRE